MRVPRGWMGLALGLGLMLAAVVVLHQASSSASDVVAQGRTQGLESDAYFYSEVSDVRAFLREGGRYVPRSTPAAP
jgi:hypothetical protein